MLKAADIVALAARKWPEVLRAEVAGEALFPLKIRFGRPPTTGDLAKLRGEVTALAAEARGWRIEWKEIRTRKWGRQRWPMRILFDTVEDMASALGRASELEAFRTAVRDTRQVCPNLEPWLRTNAHRIVEHLSYWRGLVAVCAYFDANPKPDCFPRQIPVAVDTKFIECHEAILWELLDVTLAERANQSATTFAERFHLRIEPPQVRFRFLDPELQAQTGWPVSECFVAAPAFASLTWTVPRVLIIENRDVFLCLPPVPRAVAVFGAGKAASLLSACDWMSTADVVYWGDCDEAGYGILSALRARFPQVRSLLMDEPTWSRWKHFAVAGKRDATVDHAHLTPTERAALKSVLSGPWLLEQERIPSADAERAVVAVFTRPTRA